MDSSRSIQWPAQRCARAGLRYRHARLLFDALYLADALMLSKGSVVKAARRAALRQESVHRMVRRLEGSK